MVDVATLFPLILVALTFVVIGMFFIVYLMIIGEREKNKLRAKLEAFDKMEETQECAHFFGYLSGYPLNEPIPDECFGCPKAIDCMNHQSQTNDNASETMEQPEEPQQTEQVEQQQTPG
jgi:hypothetical protein